MNILSFFVENWNAFFSFLKEFEMYSFPIFCVIFNFLIKAIIYK